MKHGEFYKALGQGTLPGVLLFIGPEQYVKERALQSLKAQVVQEGTEELNYQVLESPVSAEAIIAAAETLPFMAERRLLVVKDCPLLQKPRKDEGKGEMKEQGEMLARWLPGPETTLLVFYQRTDHDGRRQVYKAVSKLGAVVQFDDLSDQELDRWLVREMKNEGRSMTAAARRLLPRLSGRSLWTLRNQLDKLLAYTSGEITEAEVEMLATRTAEYNAFAMMDMLTQGRAGEAMGLYHGLIQAGESSMGLLALFAYNLRRMVRASDLMAKRAYSPGELAGEMGIPVFAAGKLINQLKRYQRKTLVRALSHCSEVDWQIKSGQVQMDEAIERWMLDFALGGR